MRKIRCFLVIICAMVLISQFLPLDAFAGGTAAEAQALIDKAVQYYKENGKEKAIASINDPNGGFVRGDLYIFMLNYGGDTLAHGANPKLVGKNMNDLKDAGGKLFIQEFAKTVKSGGGWVDYQWTNPETKKVHDKSTFVKGIDGTDLYLGCGIYK
jgi:cytochrome c